MHYLEGTALGMPPNIMPCLIASR